MLLVFILHGWILSTQPSYYVVEVDLTDMEGYSEYFRWENEVIACFVWCNSLSLLSAAYVLGIVLTPFYAIPVFSLQPDFRKLRYREVRVTTNKLWNWALNAVPANSRALALISGTVLPTGYDLSTRSGKFLWHM